MWSIFRVGKCSWAVAYGSNFKNEIVFKVYVNLKFVGMLAEYFVNTEKYSFDNMNATFVFLYFCHIYN